MITSGRVRPIGLIDRVAKWLKNQRAVADDRRALSCCSAGEMERLARDVGVSSSAELLELIGKGPDSADLLYEMAEVLDIPLEAVRRTQPGVVRELEARCSRCDCKGRCAHELHDGTARENYSEFCPNAETLDALRP
jgi:transcriptional regulator with XRE-family HTH domain